MSHQLEIPDMKEIFGENISIKCKVIGHHVLSGKMSFLPGGGSTIL